MSRMHPSLLRALRTAGRSHRSERVPSGTGAAVGLYAVLRSLIYNSNFSPLSYSSLSRELAHPKEIRSRMETHVITQELGPVWQYGCSNYLNLVS